MDGILIIDKPAGITSHDVVAKVRRILKTRRVGHTGTLDPFATGVMVVLVGQATRLAQYLDKDEKEYEATIRFGFETETGDRTGTAKAPAAGTVSAADVTNVLAEFTGEIHQTPPMYSAKKIDGKKLYELARKGIEVDRAATAVTIIRLEAIDGPAVRNADDGTTEVAIRVACSAGTYVRTLAEDIGRRIGVGAHLSELRRTRAGKFDLSQSFTIDELLVLPEPASALLAKELAVSHLPKFDLDEDRVQKTRNGLSSRAFDSKFAENKPVRMVDMSGTLIAIGVFDAAENVIQPKVVLI